MLDIYGEDDLDTIIASIDDRAESAKKAGNKKYTQVEVEGANHFFDGKEDALLEAVAGWLKKVSAR